MDYKKAWSELKEEVRALQTKAKERQLLSRANAYDDVYQLMLTKEEEG